MEIPQPLKPRYASALGQPLALLTYPLQILGAYRGADPLFDLGLTYFIPRYHIKLFHDSEVAISDHLPRFGAPFLSPPLWKGQGAHISSGLLAISIKVSGEERS